MEEIPREHPKETVEGKKTIYACIICGMKSHNRRGIIDHIGKHGLIILERFNLDAIFRQQDRKAETLPCLANPTCSFAMEKLDRHRCLHKHCGNSNARLVHRIEEFEIEKKTAWKIKSVSGSEYKQNEDYIETNNELITLLKRKTKQVEDENAKLRDRRGMFN